MESIEVEEYHPCFKDGRWLVEGRGSSFWGCRDQREAELLSWACNLSYLKGKFSEIIKRESK